MPGPPASRAGPSIYTGATKVARPNGGFKGVDCSTLLPTYLTQDDLVMTSGESGFGPSLGCPDPEWCRHLTIPECGTRSCRSGAPEERGRGAATEAIALVRPLVIVGLHECLQTALQRRPAGEVAADGRPRASAPAGSRLAAARRTRSSTHAAASSGCGGGRASDRRHRTPPLNSGPPSVSTRRSRQPARRYSGIRNRRRKCVAAAAV